MSRLARYTFAASSIALALVLSSCAASSTSSVAATGGKIAVKASDKGCEVASTTVAAGTTTFAVENAGATGTEFYVYAADGTKIVAEVENIGPGISRDLTAQLTAGNYITACKPGGTGDGIRGKFTVTGGSASPTGNTAAVEKAVAEYKTFVATEATQLLTKTGTFVAAVKAGNVAAAKAAYPAARVHWERIEPVAESFGDLDPKMDARENDVEAGTPWTGWHKLEKELWITGLTKDSGALADGLLTNTQDLVTRIAGVTFKPAELGNGAKELLDEVATGKVTGEEERYSRTDLWDFAANVDGAERAFEVLTPIAAVKDPALVATLTARFATLQTELAKYKKGDGYVLYNELSKAQIKELADLVDALSEPLSKLTAAVVS